MAKLDPDALLSFPIFKGLAVDQLDRLLEGASVRKFASESLIVREGDMPRHLHLLSGGMVELSNRSGGADAAF